jgi:hypothetical protein
VSRADELGEVAVTARAVVPADATLGWASVGVKAFSPPQPASIVATASVARRALERDLMVAPRKLETDDCR